MQNFQARNPTLQERSGPQKRVMKPSMKMVRIIAIGPCMKVAHSPTTLAKPSKFA